MEPNTPPTNPTPTTPAPEPTPTPATPQPTPVPPKAPEEVLAKLPASAQKVIKKNSKWIIIGCGVVALAAIIFGVVQLVLNLQTQNEMEVLRVELEEKAALVTKYAAQLGLDVSQSNNPNLKPGTTTPTNPDGEAGTTTPSEDKYIASKNYIYIGEWGIKIRIPTKLSQVSYVFESVYLGSDTAESEPKMQQTVCVYGVPNTFTGTYTPDFANPDQNTRLGCLTRHDTEIKTASTSVGKIGDYYYYYIHPQFVASTNLEEQKLEIEAVDLIKQMLTNKNNITRF